VCCSYATSFELPHKRSKAGGGIPKGHLLDGLRQPFFEIVLFDGRDAPML